MEDEHRKGDQRLVIHKATPFGAQKEGAVMAKQTSQMQVQPMGQPPEGGPANTDAGMSGPPGAVGGGPDLASLVQAAALANQPRHPAEAGHTLHVPGQHGHNAGHTHHQPRHPAERGGKY